MKRVLVLLSVVALMVLMVAMSVAPAFAAWTGSGGQCREGDQLFGPLLPGTPVLDKKNRNGDQWLCTGERVHGNVSTSYYCDNRYYIG